MNNENPINEEFKKPIGKWLNEEEESEGVIRTFDPRTRKISEEKVVEKKEVRVIYEKTKIDGEFCGEFEHVWKIIDSHKYIIKCKNCPLHKHISPGREYIDQEGHVRLRSNDSIIA